jgi:septal ring factor EnvC (AmiA/AmiB activator)
MPKQKNLAELNAEKEKIEQQLAQEQHKKQRLENRIAYYERGDRTKRAHNLIVRSADMESIAPLKLELNFVRHGSTVVPSLLL